MKISTRGTYALEAVLALALFPKEKRVSIREISDITGISDNYLEQIFTLLRKQGIIVSSRGAKGGYHLGREPEAISIGDLLRATEKSIAPVLCIEDNDYCPNNNLCMTRQAWAQLNDAVVSYVDHVTILDLVKNFKKYENQVGFDYSI